MPSKAWDHIKLIAITVGVSALVIGVLALAVVAIPIMIALGITLATYFIIRILNEDIDKG